MKSMSMNIFRLLSTICTVVLLAPMVPSVGTAAVTCESAFATYTVKSTQTKVSGRTVAYESFIVDPTQMTYILLPGIYRGLAKEDAMLKILQDQRMNYISMQWSPHLESQIQSFKNKGQAISDITLQDLMTEIQMVVKENKVQNPQLVSLSQSSAVTSLLKKNQVKVLIETAPIGDFNESNPNAKKIDDSMKMASAFNPFMAMMYKAAKDNAYRSHWTGVVNGFKDSSPELNNSNLFNRTVSSYIALAKATENYNILKMDFSQGPKRVFILAAKEEATRMEYQIKAIKQYKSQTGEWPLVYLIKDAGHIVPKDAPMAMVQVLLDIQKRDSVQNATDPFFATVSPEGEFTWLEKSTAEEILSKL